MHFGRGLVPVGQRLIVKVSSRSLQQRRARPGFSRFSHSPFPGALEPQQEMTQCQGPQPVTCAWGQEPPRCPRRRALGSWGPAAERDTGDAPRWGRPQTARTTVPRGREEPLLKSVHKDLGFRLLFRDHPDSRNKVSPDQLLSFKNMYIQ